MYASVDGTDFIINEPSPFSSKWFSHKHHGPGLRYEISISLREDCIVWSSGPYCCGSNPDQTIFSNHLRQMIPEEEAVVADAGYSGTKCLVPGQASSSIVRNLHKRSRARHETINERLKNFSILKHVFRHNINLHQKVFFAVLNITELLLRGGDNLFDID